jgi:hypothetical protein
LARTTTPPPALAIYIYIYIYIASFWSLWTSYRQRLWPLYMADPSTLMDGRLTTDNNRVFLKRQKWPWILIRGSKPRLTDWLTDCQ